MAEEQYRSGKGQPSVENEGTSESDDGCGHPRWQGSRLGDSVDPDVALLQK